MCVRERKREKRPCIIQEKRFTILSHICGEEKKRKAGGWGEVGEGTAGAKRKTERENEKLERETELIVIAVALREIVGIIIIINTIIAVCTKRSLFFFSFFLFLHHFFLWGKCQSLSLYLSPPTEFLQL